MKRVFYFIVFTIVVSCTDSRLKYPETKKINQTDDYFSIKVEDPYRWLEDDGSKDVNSWIKAQNGTTSDYLSNIPYRDKIKNRLEKIWNYEKMSVPKKVNGHFIYLKNTGSQNQDVLYISKGGKEKVLLDPNNFSKEGTVALVSSMLEISPKGKYLAYGVTKNGSDWNEIYILNIKTGEKLVDHLDWIKFSSISWNGDGFYYSGYQEPKGGKKNSKINEGQGVYFHKLGTPQAEDLLVYKDPSFQKLNYTTDIVGGGKYLIIYQAKSTSGNIVYIKNLLKKDDPLIRLTANYDYNYSVIGSIKDNLFILTDYKSPKYKLISLNINSLELGKWNTVIPESGDVLEGAHIIGNKILAQYISNAYSKLKIYTIDGQNESEVSLPGIGTITELEADKEGDEFYYAYESFTVPKTIYKYSLEKASTEIYFEPKLDIDIQKFDTYQVQFKSKDGTKIPMFLVHEKGINKNASNPTLLYGYGGFNISVKPRFSLGNLILLENGGVLAVANIRGGGEKGEKWHLAGSGFNKQNVFDDFIYGAKYLIKEKYTSPDYLAIHGGSNGGLLVGAVTNQAPELFAVALPAVGVMDMLRYHKFTIGWAWKQEYGSSDDSAQFANIYKYSPLHNISSEINYPSVMAFTADHDDRVVPAHSFKYIATLQEKYRGNNPIIIYIQTGAGHGAGKPTAMKIQESADKWAFVFYNMKYMPKY